MSSLLSGRSQFVMQTGVTQRHAGAKGAAAFPTVDWDKMTHAAVASRGGGGGGSEATQSLVGAEQGTRGSTTFDVGGTMGLKNLPIRRISLADGIDMRGLMTQEVEEEVAQWGTFLGWMRLIFGVLYGAAAIGLLFTVIFKTHGEFPLYEDPLRYSHLDKKWEVALEKVGNVHVDWALVALLSLFSAYHFVHFLPFVRDIYLRLVFYYQMNVIRWMFHGLVGGLMLGFCSIVMGVSNIIVFVLLTLAVVAAAAGALFSEMINMPALYNVGPNDTAGSLANDHGLSASEAAKAIRKEHFIKRETVTPWPILFAAIAAVAFVGVTSYYFWVAVADQTDQVPWFAWSTYFISMFTLFVIVVLNGLALLINWSVFRQYIYIDIAHNILELLFALVQVLLIIVGLAVAA